ncbi:hypothetical protein ACFOHQ_07450 [Xanthomonas fragariae]
MHVNERTLSAAALKKLLFSSGLKQQARRCSRRVKCSLAQVVHAQQIMHIQAAAERRQSHAHLLNNIIDVKA